MREKNLLSRLVPSSDLALLPVFMKINRNKAVFEKCCIVELLSRVAGVLAGAVE